MDTLGDDPSWGHPEDFRTTGSQQVPGSMRIPGALAGKKKHKLDTQK